ncbi:alpha/beta hydrolase [Aeromicrobium alkaliterrae]|uniref:Alpha/beta hydrolase n=1 Tax=Aeromicrobium alkaliterrae TaxID=302168 RepID=A0ABN2KAB4_9ACTN
MGSHLTVAADAQFRSGASVPSQLLAFGLKHTVRPLLDTWARLPFDVFPPNLLEHAARLLPAPEGTRWRTVDLPHCRAEYVMGADVPDAPGRGGAILYMHGGAFLTCGLNTHRRLVSRISSAAGSPALNVGYRQMPYEPITESIADGLEGLHWLLAQGHRIEDVTIAGDSAGGYLAFAIARAAMDAGLGRPAGVVALSPLLDFDPAGKAAHRNAHRCQTFSMRAVAKLTDVTDRLDARRGVSGRRTNPVDMPLADMPPTLIHVGSREILLADAELMANRLVAAGVPCDLTVWDRQVHVFQAAASWVPEGRAAIGEIGEFISSLEAQETGAHTPAAASETATRRSGRRRSAAPA